MCVLQGGLTGLITGLVITLWLGIGAQVYPPLPIKTRPLPLTVAGCISDPNITSTVAAWSNTTIPTSEPRQDFLSLVRGSVVSLNRLYFDKSDLMLPITNWLMNTHVIFESFGVTFFIVIEVVLIATCNCSHSAMRDQLLQILGILCPTCISVLWARW